MKILSKIKQLFVVIWQLISVELVIMIIALILLKRVFHQEITTFLLVVFLIGWTILKIVIEFFYYHVFYEKDDNEHEENLKEDIKEYYLRKYVANKLSKDEYDDYMKLLSKKDLSELIDLSLEVNKQINSEQFKEQLQDTIKIKSEDQVKSNAQE